MFHSHVSMTENISSRRWKNYDAFRKLIKFCFTIEGSALLSKSMKIPVVAMKRNKWHRKIAPNSMSELQVHLRSVSCCFHIDIASSRLLSTKWDSWHWKNWIVLIVSHGPICIELLTEFLIYNDIYKLSYKEK